MFCFCVCLRLVTLAIPQNIVKGERPLNPSEALTSAAKRPYPPALSEFICTENHSAGGMDDLTLPSESSFSVNISVPACGGPIPVSVHYGKHLQSRMQNCFHGIPLLCINLEYSKIFLQLKRVFLSRACLLFPYLYISSPSPWLLKFWMFSSLPHLF